MSVGYSGVLPLTMPNYTRFSEGHVVKTIEIPATRELEIVARIHTTRVDDTWLVEGEKQSSVLVAGPVVTPHTY